MKTKVISDLINTIMAHKSAKNISYAESKHILKAITEDTCISVDASYSIESRVFGTRDIITSYATIRCDKCPRGKSDCSRCDTCPHFVAILSKDKFNKNTGEIEMEVFCIREDCEDVDDECGEDDN